MTDKASVPGLPQADVADPPARLSAITAGLIAVGLTAELSHTKTGLAVTATFRRPGHKETDVIIDEDGRAELRWWTDLGMTPAQVTTAIVRAVTAVTAIPPARTQDGARQ